MRVDFLFSAVLEEKKSRKVDSAEEKQGKCLTEPGIRSTMYEVFCILCLTRPLEEIPGGRALFSGG